MRLAKMAWFDFNFLMKPDLAEKYANDPLFLEVMAEALSIQDRFAAEPVYAKTGKGYLKSAGVEELKRIKEASKQSAKKP
jgi:hypothetical protein